MKKNSIIQRKQKVNQNGNVIPVSKKSGNMFLIFDLKISISLFACNSTLPYHKNKSLQKKFNTGSSVNNSTGLSKLKLSKIYFNPLLNTGNLSNGI